MLDAVVTGPPRGGFGAGVAAALAAESEAGVASAGSDGAPDHWLWLLHDDAVPAADTLQQLLGHVVTDPGVDITGPKLVFPRRRHNAGHQISEVGASIARTGRRDLGLDLGEIDQGQRDQPKQHLGVSTCGMLLRAGRLARPRRAGSRRRLLPGRGRARLAGHRTRTPGRHHPPRGDGAPPSGPGRTATPGRRRQAPRPGRPAARAAADPRTRPDLAAALHLAAARAGLPDPGPGLPARQGPAALP